jgi:endogenous inhibitor of DNA gyrase (YacG/DUF329 family)
MDCPICKKKVEDPLPGQPPPKYWPFCSERCKLVDLGRWLDGKYQIPVVISSDDAEDSRDD